MKTRLTLGLLAAALLAAAGLHAANTTPPPQTMLVLDASGSMWGQIGGKSKIAIAREAVGSMLDGWNGGDLGLMAYGHNRKGDCADIQVLQGIGPNTAAGIRRQVNALNPKGMTPITASVRMAAEQLRYTEQKATVILVSDGEETCNADPCALGKELEAAGVDFTAHVVGFDIQKGSRAHQQLQCLAANTGGRYIEARNAAELNDALGEVAAAPPAPTAQVKSAQEWLPGYSLTWVAGTQLEGVEDNGGTQSMNFRTNQTAKDCQAMCYANGQCAAWHYEPTGSYFIDHPRCFLKGRGAPLRLEKQDDNNWVAGVKPGVQIILENGTTLTTGGGMAGTAAPGASPATSQATPANNGQRNVVGEKVQRQAERQQQRAEDATDRATDKVADKLFDRLFGR